MRKCASKRKGIFAEQTDANRSGQQREQEHAGIVLQRTGKIGEIDDSINITSKQDSSEPEENMMSRRTAKYRGSYAQDSQRIVTFAVCNVLLGLCMAGLVLLSYFHQLQREEAVQRQAKFLLSALAEYQSQG